MTFVANTVLKPVSMATNGCLISSPSLFNSSKIKCLHSSLSISNKPIKFQLSCKKIASLSSHSLFSAQRKESLLRVSVVASQEENNPVILEEKEEGEGGLLGDLNWEASVKDGSEDEGEESDVAAEGEGDGYVEAPEGTKVYVGNLPYDVDGENLAMLFSKAGIVDMAQVIVDRATEQSRGFGFVTMSTVEEAEKAVEMFNRYDLSGRLLTVNIAAPRGARPERDAPHRAFGASYKLYVGNLAWNVDSERLEQVFSEHGKVVSARVIPDMESGKSRGFGFVVMSSEAEMNDAIANLDGQSLDGRAIRVNAATERPPRRSRF
ncbi:hypothetical protein ACS0TY_007094 [Phlomoides rotata]